MPRCSNHWLTDFPGAQLGQDKSSSMMMFSMSLSLGFFLEENLEFSMEIHKQLVSWCPTCISVWFIGQSLECNISSGYAHNKQFPFVFQQWQRPKSKDSVNANRTFACGPWHWFQLNPGELVVLTDGSLGEPLAGCQDAT